MTITRPGAGPKGPAAPGHLPAAPAGGRSQRRGSGWRRRARVVEAAWAYLLIAPVGLGLGVFYLWPVVQTGYFSFTEWGPFGGNTWTGWANYQTLLADAEVRRALRNTVAFTVLGLAGIPLALVFAALLNRRGLRGLTVYRTLFFLPVVTMPVAVAMVWRWLYNGDFGLINYLLSLIGIEGPHWLADRRTALYALVVIGIWSFLGYQVVIFLAGMQAVSRDFYEAAEIDGAGLVTQFRKITVPLLTPTIFFVTVISVIGSMQLFDLVFVISGSGGAARTNPAFPSTQTVVHLFYEKAFVTNERGYAAAIVVALLLLIVTLTAIQFRLQRRWVHYA